VLRIVLVLDAVVLLWGSRTSTLAHLNYLRFFSQSEYQAYKAVDNIKVQTYWQLGERIVREELKHQNRADYGKYLIDNLAVDLGIGRLKLYRIVKFYRLHEIVSAVPIQLSWGHFIELIGLDDSEERLFYQHKAIISSWGVRELRRQTQRRLYQNTSKNEIEEIFKAKLSATQPYEIFKDTYNFNFIDLRSDDYEKDLENKILDSLEMFLKELGEDFCISGRQVPIKIDRKTHYIDLVLYHKGIPCNVLVDLKIGKLDSGDIGQMNKYIGYYRRSKQYEHEKDTIGLIICREAVREEVVYALDGLEKKIFIVKYKVKLPSEAKIKQAIRKIGTKNK
jgi:predicted nuclease of restriction endonuclease-like (RecB) superfamily